MDAFFRLVFSCKLQIVMLLLLLSLHNITEAQRKIKWGNKWYTYYDCKFSPPKIYEPNIDTLEKEGKITVAGTDTNEVYEGDNDSDVTIPNIKYGEFTNLQWRPVAFFHNQLFPSAIISLANYKGEQANKMFEAIKKPLGFYILSNKSNIPLRWEIECVDKNLFDKTGGYFTYKTKNRLCYLQADIPWNYKALMNNTTAAPVNIFFRLYDIHGNKVEKLITVTLRSVDECIYKYKDLNLNFELSSFIQEEDTAIDGILRDAAKYKMVDAFWGYQKDSNYVDRQVAVIWQLMHNRGYAFYDIPVSSIDSNDNKNSIYSFHARPLQYALRVKVESTVDGNIIFASILKHIGLNPVFVIIPGHCLLGYYVNDQSIHYLKTSLLSNQYVRYNNQVTDVIPNAKTPIEKNKAFAKLFEAARKEGDREFNEADAEQRIVVDVSYCRQFISSLPIYN